MTIDNTEDKIKDTANQEIEDNSVIEDAVLVDSASSEAPPEDQHVYYIATVKVVFMRKDKPRERTVNVLLDLVVPYISQATLNDVNRAAVGRVMSENEVPGDQIREVVIMNISLLGLMTPSTFKNDPHQTVYMNEFIQ